jgi:hypothetical protein
MRVFYLEIPDNPKHDEKKNDGQADYPYVPESVHGFP